MILVAQLPQSQIVKAENNFFDSMKEEFGVGEDDFNESDDRMHTPKKPY